MTNGETVSEETIVRKKIQPLKKAVAKKAVEKTALDNYKEKVERDHASLTQTTPANMPSSFKALHKEDLVKAAQAFGTLAEGSEELIRADLEDAGITWAAYCVEFGLPVPEDYEDQTIDFPEPVTDWEESEDEELPEIATVEEVPTLQANQKYLVKFVGDNPYFEYKKYKFTKDSPYAIMPAKDAQDILSLADEQTGRPEFPPKFRQAFPVELQEYYS